MLFFILIICVGSIYLILQNKEKQKSAPEKLITQEKVPELIENPKIYVGYEVEASGVVDRSNYVKGKGVYSALLLDPKEYKDPIVILQKGEKKPLKQQSIVNFSGKVSKVYKGTDKLGMKGSLAQVDIKSIEVGEGETFENEVLINLDVHEKSEVEKVLLEIEKIKVYQSGTRISIFLYNKNKKRIYLNDATIKLVADGVVVPTKFEILDQKDRLLHTLESDQGTHGVLSFNRIAKTTKNLELSFQITLVNETKPITIKKKIKFS